MLWGSLHDDEAVHVFMYLSCRDRVRLGACCWLARRQSAMAVAALPPMHTWHCADGIYTTTSRQPPCAVPLQFCDSCVVLVDARFDGDSRIYAHNSTIVLIRCVITCTGRFVVAVSSRIHMIDCDAHVASLIRCSCTSLLRISHCHVSSRDAAKPSITLRNSSVECVAARFKGRGATTVFVNGRPISFCVAHSTFATASAVEFFQCKPPSDAVFVNSTSASRSLCVSTYSTRHFRRR